MHLVACFRRLNEGARNRSLVIGLKGKYEVYLLLKPLGNRCGYIGGDGEQVIVFVLKSSPTLGHLRAGSFDIALLPVGGSHHAYFDAEDEAVTVVYNVVKLELPLCWRYSCEWLAVSRNWCHSDGNLNVWGRFTDRRGACCAVRRGSSHHGLDRWVFDCDYERIHARCGPVEREFTPLVRDNYRVSRVLDGLSGGTFTVNVFKVNDLVRVARLNIDAKFLCPVRR